MWVILWVEVLSKFLIKCCVRSELWRPTKKSTDFGAIRCEIRLHITKFDFDMITLSSINMYFHIS